MSVPDEELATAYVVHDDESAFRVLYQRLSPYLLRLARRRVGSPEVASDLVQQAFLNAHLARDRFQLGSEFKPWITRILMNLVLDHFRASRRRPRADIDPVDLAAPELAAPADRSEDVSLALRALKSLKPRQRRVVEMHWIEERPFPEVARALGEGLSAVKVRAHRAYRQMRRTLEQSQALPAARVSRPRDGG